jgi:hypothetical protein
MKNKQPSIATKIAIGAAVAVAVLVARGLAPELYRYLRIRKM